MIKNQRKLSVSAAVPLGNRDWQSALMIISICLLSSAASVNAQGNWFATGYLQYSQGDYIFGSNTATFYLVPGLRYEARGWNFSAILPVVSQNNNLVTQVGGILVPHGGSSNMGGMGNSGAMSTTGSMSNIVGLGDLFLSGEYQIVHPDFDQTQAGSPTLGVDIQVKVPTASTAHNFGTGKFDFGSSINYRQMFGTFVVMANAGYIVLGKPAGVEFNNPFTYGGGVGKFFNNEDFSVALMYQGYTAVLSGYPPPDQASLGLNYKVSSGVIGAVVFSKGLTNTALSFGVTGGFRWSL